VSAFRYEWFSTPPKLIFDVGAYDGADSIRFKEWFPECRVVAFEACPDNFAALHGRVAGTGVEFLHYAVCDTDGEVPFFSNTDTNFPGHFGQSGSILVPTPRIAEKWAKGNRRIDFHKVRMVQAIKLGTFCRLYGITEIDLLHIDAQGAEKQVIEGLDDMRPKMIFLEIDEVAEVGGYDGATPMAELVECLTSRAYAKKWESPNDALYALA